MGVVTVHDEDILVSGNLELAPPEREQNESYRALHSFVDGRSKKACVGRKGP
jgi:hypothetical protein